MIFFLLSAWFCIINGFDITLQFVMLSSDGLGGVNKHVRGGILSKYSPETVC